MKTNRRTRRKFIQDTVLLSAAISPALITPSSKGAGSNQIESRMQTTANGSVPRRRLGKTDIEVSILGVGCYHLGSAKNQDEAKEIVQHALDAGLNFFDNAWEYHDGQSEEWLGAALGGRRKEAVLMTKVCTHGRDKKVAMQMLEESLAV